MVLYTDPNLVKTQQMGLPLNFRVVLIVNKYAQKLRFPATAGTHFVIPKALLGTPPEGSSAKRIVVDDFVKEVSYESKSVYNKEWPPSIIGAEPISLTLVMDNRWGRFNYIAPGTVVQLQRMVNGKMTPFLTTYVWNSDR